MGWGRGAVHVLSHSGPLSGSMACLMWLRESAAPEIGDTPGSEAETRSTCFAAAHSRRHVRRAALGSCADDSRAFLLVCLDCPSNLPRSSPRKTFKTHGRPITCAIKPRATA